jgi:hypothetical protein
MNMDKPSSVGTTRVPLNWYVMRLSFIVCLAIIGCAANSASAPDINAQCEIYPAVEWTKLPSPPPEADKLLKLAIYRRQLSSRQTSASVEFWFRSDTGTFRYCRYTRSPDPCNGPEHYDFQFYYGKWNVTGGPETICLNAEHLS